MWKTHLLSATEDYIKKNRPEQNIWSTSVEKFVNTFIEALYSHTTKELHQKYEETDVLIIDDIQNFAGKENSIDEFLHLFDICKETGKQILLAGNLWGKEASAEMNASNMKKLFERLQAGIAIKLQTPDSEMRKKILKEEMKSIVQERNIAMDFSESDKILDYILADENGNIAAEEGRLSTILGLASILNEPVNLAFAKRALNINQ